MRQKKNSMQIPIDGGRIMRMEPKIAYASITNKGARKVNEDSLQATANASEGFFVLCDGLGGHGNGDLASSFVVSQMTESWKKNESIEDSILHAQEGLLAKQVIEKKEDSMKTTLTGLWIKNGIAKFAHVGDSRIYYFEKNKYRIRSLDHSVPQMLVNNGDIKEKAIRKHEDRSRLLRVMGVTWTSPKYQISKPVSCTDKSSFLLCSDGFWELIDEKVMCKTLKKSATPEEWLDKMEEIVKANGAGTNMDNYSAIAVFIR